MKTNDFSYYIRNFLTHYLPTEKNYSANTIDAYRTAFILFLEFLSIQGIKAEKVEIRDITRQRIMDFLDWLESERNCGISTRNSRLAAIHSFFRYLQYEMPDYLDEYQRILYLPFKKTRNIEMAYLTVEETKTLFEQVDTTTTEGYRDYVLLLTMYETAIRVSELADIRIGDFRMTKPFSLKVIGKGNKERTIPVSESYMNKIQKYMDLQDMKNRPLTDLMFVSNRKEKLTRHGIAYILKKYVKKAREQHPELFRKNITPHTMRHTKAMHLLGDDVNLIYIRDVLGHTSVTTTERYARVDSAKKREALEKSYRIFGNDNHQEWKNESILDWLKSF